jgi:large subunit ribosomal protein L29
MAGLKTKEIRELTGPERKDKLYELRNELMHEQGIAAMGGAPTNPGKIRALRISIARMLTVMKEEGEL